MIAPLAPGATPVLARALASPGGSLLARQAAASLSGAVLVMSDSAAAASASASSTAAATAAALTTGTAAEASASSAMHSLSGVLSSASAALASESAALAAAAGEGGANPGYFKYIGIAMAIASGFFIGSSFVLKKRGLLAAQRRFNSTAGEGLSYLKSPLWWSGMIIMIIGEVLNLVAYSFTDAILVTPMGALSVVVSAILSSFFLQEKLSLFGWLGCGLCILGSTIIALNGPDQHASGQIKQFEKMFIAPGFLAWTGVCIATALGLIFFVVPRYGKKNMLVHISICSVIGGLSVSVTSGLGSAILLSIRGQNQFKHWFIYFLFAFVIVTLLTEIVYLNKALELFNTAMVTPTYYVLFTFMTLVTSIVLFQGLSASVVAIITIVLGFLVICVGITILQLSKIDPEDLAKKPGVDRSTTMLLKASRSHVRHSEKAESTQIEDPGVDTIRGGLGIVGSVIRARSSRRFSSRRFNSSADEYHHASAGLAGDEMGALRGVGHDVERYQLRDGPVPSARDRDRLSPHEARGMPVKRDTAISWAPGSDGHDREKPPGSPVLDESERRRNQQSTLAILRGGSADSPGPLVRTPDEEPAAGDLSGSSASISKDASPADELSQDDIVRRVYNTEPRNGAAALAYRDAQAQWGIKVPPRQQSRGQQAQPHAQKQQQARYADPYAAAPSAGARMPPPPAGDNLRGMWQHRHKGSVNTASSSDSEPGLMLGVPGVEADASRSQLSLLGGDAPAGAKLRSDRSFPLRKGDRPVGEEDELLRPQASNDSEEEEERAKTRQQRGLFTFF